MERKITITLALLLLVLSAWFLYTTNVTSYIKNNVEDNNIIIYTKTHCPFCVKAKNLLNLYNAKYKEITIQNTAAMKEMAQLTNAKTVPQIIINNKLIGGFDQLNALHKQNELQKILN